MTQTIKTEILVLGSGPAGNTAAIYTVRSGLKTTILQGQRVGGQLTVTSDVENFPGFEQPIPGGELMQKMIDQCKNLGVETIEDTITSVDLDKKPIKCVGESGNIYESDALIIATGAEARWLKAPAKASIWSS